MSLASWKAEFYPVRASEVEEQDAIAHSLKKWEGLRPDVLKRHGLAKEFRNIFDSKNNNFRVDASSCAMCVHWRDEDESHGALCASCPIMRKIGRRCDDRPHQKFVESEYGAWLDNDDPEPMIALLSSLPSPVLVPPPYERFYDTPSTYYE